MKNKVKLFIKIDIQPFNTTSQYYDILSEMNHWTIIYEDKSKNFEQCGFSSIKKNANQVQEQSKQQAQLMQLPASKVIQAKSLVNYLPPSFQTQPLQVLNFCLPFFGAHDNILNQKLNSLKEKLASNQQTIGQMMRTCRKRMPLCFSSKWRQPQKILYLLVHKFISSERQISKVRIHILNHRGLILQTILNIDDNQVFQEISRTIQRHYRRLEAIIVFVPQSNILNLDKLSCFFKELGDYQILVLFSKKRESLNLSIISMIGAYQHFQGPNSICLAISKQQQIIMGYIRRLKIHKMNQILRSLTQLIKRESQIAKNLQKVDYFSGHFSQQQISLRFYAYLFNLITLEGMQLQKKQPLIAKLVDYELESFEKRAEERQNQALLPQVHTYMGYQNQSSCLICKKRTKIRCQKCCLQFNKLFGLCQKECFSVFHEDMPTYIERILKSKKNYKIMRQDDSRQEKQQKYEESLLGRKMRKKDEVNDQYKNFENKAALQTVEEITRKWKQYVAQNQNNFDILQQYGTARLVPLNFFKKIEYISKKIAETRTFSEKEAEVKVQPNMYMQDS